MKDQQTLLWLYKNSKTQLFPMLALILSNAVFSGCGILFALEFISTLPDKTCILISHKKTALSVCDKEIRIENGSLITVERRRPLATHTA